MRHQRFMWILSVLSTVILLLLLFPATAFAAGENDLDGHWAASAIETCHTYGIINGDGNGVYKPNDDITRAEFAAMVNRAFGYDALNLTESENVGVIYSDIPASKWYAKDMKTAIALGYISGYGNGIAAPEDKVTREQAAVILSRILRLTPDDGEAPGFTDMGDVSAWGR